MTLATACPKPERREPKERKRVTRQSKQGRLEHRAELACSRLADIRANGLCEFCGRPGNQTAHGWGKGAYPSVRFDGRNLFWSCHECHMKGHRQHWWWVDQMERIIGGRVYVDLAFARFKKQMDDPKDVIAAAKQGRFLVERT